MTCESFFTTATVNMSSVFPGGGYFSDINLRSVGEISNQLTALYPGYDCATLESLLPGVFDQPQATNNSIVKSTGFINLATVAASIVATGSALFPGGTFHINLFETDIGGSETAYGYWEIVWSWDGSSTIFTVADFTTWGPGISMGDESSGPSVVDFRGTVISGSVPFQIAMAVNVTLAVQSIDDTAGYLACVIPACGVSPPSPPFPPYLPPSPPWPTITPAPTPPTPPFIPGQFPNKVLGIGANYSIFSNFGYKG